MNPADVSSRLSQIQTHWTMVFTAHREGDAAQLIGLLEQWMHADCLHQANKENEEF